MSIQMELHKIIISELQDQQIIVLKEVDGERKFPIVIGNGEAHAIDRRLKGIAHSPSAHPRFARKCDRGTRRTDLARSKSTTSRTTRFSPGFTSAGATKRSRSTAVPAMPSPWASRRSSPSSLPSMCWMKSADAASPAYFLGETTRRRIECLLVVMPAGLPILHFQPGIHDSRGLQPVFLPLSPLARSLF